MDNNTFENRMRELEYFHNLRLLPGAWVVVRVDGRGNSTGSLSPALKNPIQDKEVITIRRRLKVDEDLPMKEAYRSMVAQILETC